MARMLRARARSVVAPRRVGKLSIFLPIFLSARRARPHPTRVRRTVDRGTVPDLAQLFGLPGHQAASVGILAQRIERECFPRRPFCFAGRHVWKR